MHSDLNPGLRVREQSGAVLIVGLIMVLLMTIIGLAAIRGSGMQELMAGNMRDRNLAFQAAEAGLRAGEGVVHINVENLPVFNGSAGLHPDLNLPGKTPPTQWVAADWLVAGNSVVTAGLAPQSSSQPRYAVEKIDVPAVEAAGADGSGIDVASLETFAPPEIFRISSRGVGGTTDADVVLQSFYKR